MIVVLALACVPAAAHADLTWTAPPEDCLPGLTPPPQSCGQFLSPAGTTADNLQVATDAAGDAVAVWLQFDPSAGSGHTRVAEALRPAGGTFGAATFLSDPTVDAADPCVAMNAGGEAIACWDQPDAADSGKQHIFYAMRAPGAAFGPAQNTSAGRGGVPRRERGAQCRRRCDDRLSR